MEVWRNQGLATQNQILVTPDLSSCHSSVDLEQFSQAGMSMARIVSAEKPIRELDRHIEKQTVPGLK